MRFPWQPRLETRQDMGYADTLIAAILARANGASLVYPNATAALEACAGVVGRGFMAAEVIGPSALVDALTPDCLELIGRSLIRVGQVVFLIDVQGGRLRLMPAQTHDVEGGPDPDSWEYEVTLAGPSRTLTHRFVPASSVLHFRYAPDAVRPWRGNGPVESAALAGRLSAETMNALADESSGPVGRLLGIPKDGNDATVENLKGDIRNAKGRLAILENGDWDNVGSANVDLASKRFGAEPPQSLVNVSDHATKEIVSACGLNTALWSGGNGATVREAWRLALFGVLSPLGRKVERELQDKLDPELKLSWQELRASDLSGRARAMQSMVNGGMQVEQAIAIAGLMTPEEDD